jgi:hypothetical protein
VRHFTARKNAENNSKALSLSFGIWCLQLSVLQSTRISCHTDDSRVSNKPRQTVPLLTVELGQVNLSPYIESRNMLSSRLLQSVRSKSRSLRCGPYFPQHLLLPMHARAGSSAANPVLNTAGALLRPRNMLFVLGVLSAGGFWYWRYLTSSAYPESVKRQLRYALLAHKQSDDKTVAEQHYIRGEHVDVPRRVQPFIRQDPSLAYNT